MHLHMLSWEFLDFLLRIERVLPTLARFVRMLYDLTDKDAHCYFAMTQS